MLFQWDVELKNGICMKTSQIYFRFFARPDFENPKTAPKRMKKGTFGAGLEGGAQIPTGRNVKSLVVNELGLSFS